MTSGICFISAFATHAKSGPMMLSHFSPPLRFLKAKANGPASNILVAVMIDARSGLVQTPELNRQGASVEADP